MFKLNSSPSMQHEFNLVQDNIKSVGLSTNLSKINKISAGNAMPLILDNAPLEEVIEFTTYIFD